MLTQVPEHGGTGFHYVFDEGEWETIAKHLDALIDVAGEAKTIDEEADYGRPMFTYLRETLKRLEEI